MSLTVNSIGALIFFAALLIYLLSARRWQDARSPVLWFATLAMFVAFLITISQGWFVVAALAGVVLVVLAKTTFFEKNRKHR